MNAGGAPRVLVIEDNPINMELVTDLLETLGVDVLQASTAEEGLDVAFEQLPELILLDIRLPGMDGYEAVRRLKADGRTSGVPTLALTAQAMAADKRAAEAAGFDGYVTKPIDTRAFPGVIGRFLSRGPSEPSAGGSEA